MVLLLRKLASECVSPNKKQGACVYTLRMGECKKRKGLEKQAQTICFGKAIFLLVPLICLEKRGIPDTLLAWFI
jgi:hypothetical protein